MLNTMLNDYNSQISKRYNNNIVSINGHLFGTNSYFHIFDVYKKKFQIEKQLQR